MSDAAFLSVKPADDYHLSADWAGIIATLDAKGFAVMPKLLVPKECAKIAGLYPEDTRFRSRIVMT